MYTKLINTALGIALLTTSVANAQLKVITNGNVGLGTTTPSNPLHIKSTNSTMLVMEKPTSGAWAYVGFDFKLRPNLPSVGLYGMEWGGMTNSFGFGMNIVNNGAEKNVLRIDPVGNGYFYGNWYTNQTWLWSDRKLKNNIVTSTKSLDKILQLRGVTYDAVDSVEINQIDKATNTRKLSNVAYGKAMPYKSQYGFIAQEVEQILPNVVSSTDNGLKSVNYIQVIPLLVEAIKEQNTQIDILTAEIKKLKGTKSAAREDGKTSTEKPSTAIAYLYQNTPNPFSQETSIKYAVPETSKEAFISITDLNGKQLKALPITSKGENSVTLKANELYAGIFVYTLVVDGNIVDSKRMVIVE